MSKEEKSHYLSIMRRRYAHMRTKKARGRVLDDFCALTGLSRKHSIQTLSPQKLQSKRRGCPSGGTPEGTGLLIHLWELSDMLCSKLLVVVIPELLRSMRHHQPVCDRAAAEVLKMSAATIDRRLRPIKAADPRRSKRRRSSLDEHRRAIPLKIDVWPQEGPDRPGYLEVDTVAHCGGSMAGSFAWTLTITDIDTQWTETRSVWNRGGAAVCQALAYSAAAMPFPLLFLNSDNGGEVLNAHIARYCAQHLPQVRRSRSRGYCKNDNAHVEQKNGARVRALYGHGRIADPSLIDPMNEINALDGLIKNLHIPTMRLVSKERVGAKWIKRFEKIPKTPAQRVLESKFVSEEDKNKVRRMLEENDLIEIRTTLQMKINQLARKLTAAPAGAGSERAPEAKRIKRRKKSEPSPESPPAA